MHGLIFTAVYSRHTFVYPTHQETLEEVLTGFEAAWGFFGGVSAVVIPDTATMTDSGRRRARFAVAWRYLGYRRPTEGVEVWGSMAS